jgi:hypothetical protein
MTKSFKNMESLLSKSEMAFTEFLALSFGQKRATHSRNTFSFFKWSTLAQKKGTFFTLKKSGVAPLLPCPYILLKTCQWSDLMDPLFDMLFRMKEKLERRIENGKYPSPSFLSIVDNPSITLT